MHLEFAAKALLAAGIAYGLSACSSPSSVDSSDGTTGRVNVGGGTGNSSSSSSSSNGSSSSSGGGSSSGSNSDAGTGPCAGSPFFCDDFTTSVPAGTYTTHNGTWTRSTTSYSVTDANAWERARSTLANIESDFDLTIQGSTQGDSGMGIVYGGSADLDDGYAVLVHPAQFQGVFLKQLVPGSPDVAISSTPIGSGLAGTPLTLRVQRQGTQVTVWLNGQQVLQSSDGAAALSGRIGLLLSDTNNTANSGATITLFRIDTASPSTGGSSSSSGGAGGSSPDGGTGSGGGGPTGGSPLLGFYVSSQSPSDVASLASTLNVTAQGITMYTDGSSWSSIGGFGPPNTSLRLFLGVNLCPDGQTVINTPNNLGVYGQLAKTLVSSGHADAIIRLGWEWSGNWFAWSSSGYAAYVTAFQKVHDTMMAVSGAQFTFDWCANAGSTPTSGTYADWYPGDAYVDYIGSDHYDSTSGDPTTDWNNNLNLPGGLTYTVNFAIQHNKKVSVPEWGLNGRDDPTYIGLMAAFVNNPANRVGYEAYFSYPGTINSVITSFPNSETAFRTGFAGE